MFGREEEWKMGKHGVMQHERLKKKAPWDKSAILDRTIEQTEEICGEMLSKSIA